MTLRTVATSILLAAAALVVVFAFDLALLLFAAVLIAVVLHGASARVARLTGTSRGVGLVLVVLAIVTLIALTASFALPSLIEELAQLRVRLPEAMAKLQEIINRFGWVESIVDALPKGEVTLDRPGVAGRVTSAVSSTVGAVVNFVIVLVVALYLAADPEPYVEGMVRLFPRRRRERARAVFEAIGDTLFHWIQGQLISMTIVGLTVAAGLALLGVPLAGTLGLIAGLFEFVPNIGPVLAGVPAALLAITVSPSHVIYVIALYIVVQTAESYLLTPYVMRRVVALPPALTIVAQLVITLLGGWVGLLLATPLTAVTLVAVQKVYLEDILGEEDAQAA
jgi:predicted PurR-regulated permease PerM